MIYNQHLNLQPFSEVIAEPPATGGKEQSVDDIYDALSKDDEKAPDDEKINLEPEKPEKEVKKGKEDKEEDEIEIEEEPTEVKDENELISPVPRKEILSKYPTLFKDFPYLEKAMYREQEYTKVFPSIDDAREAKDDLEQFNNFQGAVLNGDLDVVLSSLKDANPKSYAKVINNYLPILAKTDKDAYLHVAGGVIKSVVIRMAQEANDLVRSDNEGSQQSGKNLKVAAQILNQFMRFGNDWKEQPFGGEDAKEDPEKEQISAERQQFLNERFQATLGDLQTKADKILNNTIKSNIDPKEVMSNYVRDKASKDAFDKLNELMGQDERFSNVMNNLWRKAAQSNFDAASQEKIKKAYLEKAKTLLPSVIQNSRNAALKGMGKRITENREEPVNKGPVSQGRSATSSSSRNEGGLRKGETYQDFLMRD